MKKNIAILGLFLVLSTLSGQQIKYYDLELKINVPERKIDVNGTVQIDLNDEDSISLILWKNTDINSINIDKKQVDYLFDTLGQSPNYFIPNGKSLTLKNLKSDKDEITVNFSYNCNMDNVTGWAKSFTEEWIELGFYTAWYPVHSTSKNFTSTIKVSIDKSFIVSGSGMVSNKGDVWEIKHNWPIYDNVIIASKDLKIKEIREDNIALDLVYTTFPENDLDSVSIRCKEGFNYFSSIFGTPDDSYLKFVINPLSGNGGYGRARFFTMKAGELNQYLIGGIAHEMSHFWWHNAETTTWEDWLNEAFAEYSMLIFIRDKVNKAEFNKNVKQYKEWTVNAKPIWGIDRDAMEAYDALYTKGSLILLAFENRIGTQAFFQLLNKINAKKFSNTEDFLNFIESELSKEDRDWIENKLKS